MAKDPAFLFYSGDFLTGVTGMNMEERGQYITLLCLQHAKGHLTLELINRSVPGLSSYVLEKFQQDEEGLYFNQRLEEESIKRNKFCKSRSENRKGKENKDMINICETYDKHMENENISIDISNLNNKGVEKKSSSLPFKISKKSQLTDEEFIQKKLAEGKKPLSKIDCNFTYITEKEYQKLKDLYGSPEIVNEMILIYDSWKQNHTKGVQANKSDYRGLIAGWAYERAVKVLQARQSPAVDKLRKREKIADEIQKNMGAIVYEQ